MCVCLTIRIYLHKACVPVALLHDGDFLDDLLQVRLHRNLFDGHNLPGLFIMSFKHTAIRAADTQRHFICCVKCLCYL